MQPSRPNRFRSVLVQYITFFFFVDKCTTHYLSCTHIACIKGNLLYNFKHTEIYILFCHSLSLSLASLSLSIFSQHGIKVLFSFFSRTKNGQGTINIAILPKNYCSSTISIGSEALLECRRTTVSHSFKTYGSSQPSNFMFTFFTITVSSESLLPPTPSTYKISLHRIILNYFF